MKSKILCLAIILSVFNYGSIEIRADSEINYGVITGNSVNLRSEPTISAPVLLLMERGLAVTIVECREAWALIQLPNGRQGWVYRKYLRGEISRPSSRNRFHIAPFAETALRYLGTRYSYGGSSKWGFDCSGFTQFIYGQFGYKLPHSSEEQFKLGQPVAYDHLELGDLVFFATRGSAQINHVGIYLGEAMFIHASSGAGEVKLSCINSGYYSSCYRGARRLLLEKISDECNLQPETDDNRPTAH